MLTVYIIIIINSLEMFMNIYANHVIWHLPFGCFGATIISYYKSSMSYCTSLSSCLIRSTLSPTPPSGNPSRPSRRKLPRHPEIQRPQTAYDFTPSATKNMFERRKAQVVSKSIDISQHRQIGHEDTDIIGDR